MKYFKAKVAIEVPEKSQFEVTATSDLPVKNKKLTLREKLNRAFSMLTEDFIKKQICKPLNMDIRTLDKLMCMSEEERI